MGRAYYHSGLISMRRGEHYLGCGNGNPSQAHFVLGQFDNATQSFTGLIQTQTVDGGLKRFFVAQSEMVE